MNKKQVRETFKAVPSYYAPGDRLEAAICGGMRATFCFARRQRGREGKPLETVLVHSMARHTRSEEFVTAKALSASLPGVLVRCAVKQTAAFKGGKLCLPL